jgi:hypothetical protein
MSGNIQEDPIGTCQDVHLHGKWNSPFVIIKLLCVSGPDYQLLHGLNEIAQIAAAVWNSITYRRTNYVTGREEPYTGKLKGYPMKFFFHSFIHFIYIQVIQIQV